MSRLIPSKYRLRADQRRWLKRQAVQSEEGNESRLLRRLIDQAMRVNGRKVTHAA